MGLFVNTHPKTSGVETALINAINSAHGSNIVTEYMDIHAIISVLQSKYTARTTSGKTQIYDGKKVVRVQRLDDDRVYWYGQMLNYHTKIMPNMGNTQDSGAMFGHKWGYDGPDRYYTPESLSSHPIHTAFYHSMSFTYTGSLKGGTLSIDTGVYGTSYQLYDIQYGDKLNWTSYNISTDAKIDIQFRSSYSGRDRGPTDNIVNIYIERSSKYPWEGYFTEGSSQVIL